MSRKPGNDKFYPVPEDHERMLAERLLASPDLRGKLSEPDPEMEALDVMLEARRRAGLTQEEVARRMRVKPSPRRTLRDRTPHPEPRHPHEIRQRMRMPPTNRTRA